MNNTITAVPGILVGHATDKQKLTGCTVLLSSEALRVAVDARGALPGTYNTEGIGSHSIIDYKHAIFITGGSLDGLDIATGIRHYFKEKEPNIPVVSSTGAVLYDLGKRLGFAPNADMGYRACKGATSNPVVEGNVGAGTGCTIGKLNGVRYAMKGGIGSSSRRFKSGLTVGAIAVVNAVGNIFDSDTGRTMAGARKEKGRGFLEMDEYVESYFGGRTEVDVGTTIGIVATNAYLTHPQLLRVAQVAHDGLARAIRPVHSATDGDTVFAATTGVIKKISRPGGKGRFFGLTREDVLRIDVIGYLAAEEIRKAILRAVKSASTIRFEDAHQHIIPGLKEARGRPKP